MKRLSILGSTGSIGTQTLDVARKHKDEYKVVAMSCGHRIELFENQIKEFNPVLVCVCDKDDAELLKNKFPNISVVYGDEGLLDVAGFVDCDIVVNALMGMVGFKPTIAALNAGHDLALANKETLVSGGEVVIGLAKKMGASILPVDSEHSAIFQCLQSAGPNKIKRILLTASGGPFRGYTKDQLKNVTVKQALKHPNWSMGSKITIDSATMMNKGLEVIEAATLFNVLPKDIEVVVHPESAIHSAIEFSDGSIIAQVGIPDMRIPIAYALSYPKRLDDVTNALDLFKLGSMHFEKADIETFECLGLCIYAFEKGLSYRVVLNAANEIAVDAFLKEEISFLDIPKVIKIALDNHDGRNITTADEIIDLDLRTREYTKELIKERKGN